MAQGDCSPLRTRQNAQGPLIAKVTIKNPNASAFPAADVYSGRLQFPVKWIMLAASGVGEPSFSDSLYFHFTKVGNSYSPASPLLIPNGTEQWFPIRETGYATSAIDRNGWQLVVDDQDLFQEFYVDMGAESGVIGNFVTFIYSNRIIVPTWPNRVGGGGAF